MKFNSCATIIGYNQLTSVSRVICWFTSSVALNFAATDNRVLLGRTSRERDISIPACLVSATVVLFSPQITILVFCVSGLSIVGSLRAVLIVFRRPRIPHLVPLACNVAYSL